MKTIAQGAEANILLEKNKITKLRIKKSYRLPILDEKIRKSRTKKEAKLLQKAFKLIPIPNVISTNNKDQIEMEFIKGDKLSKNLDSLPNSTSVCIQIGKNIAKLHDNSIIHGDLTTSNMLLLKNKLYFIDFGLGFISDRIEDKAVDLHLIKQALEAKHFLNYEKFFKAILKGYKISENFKKVLDQLKKVESRGRYKKQQ